MIYIYSDNNKFNSFQHYKGVDKGHRKPSPPTRIRNRPPKISAQPNRVFSLRNGRGCRVDAVLPNAFPPKPVDRLRSSRTLHFRSLFSNYTLLGEYTSEVLFCLVLKTSLECLSKVYVKTFRLITEHFSMRAQFKNTPRSTTTISAQDGRRATCHCTTAGAFAFVVINTVNYRILELFMARQQFFTASV